MDSLGQNAGKIVNARQQIKKFSFERKLFFIISHSLKKKLTLTVNKFSNRLKLFNHNAKGTALEKKTKEM